MCYPHKIEDAWFLLTELREAGFAGPGAVNDVANSEESSPGSWGWSGGRLGGRGRIVYFLELLEGFYVPSFETYREPDLAAMKRDDYCWSDGYCTASYTGVVLMAEALRTCGEADENKSMCLRAFLAENPDLGGVSFGVLDSDKADSMEDYFRVDMVQEGEFVPVGEAGPPAISEP